MPKTLPLPPLERLNELFEVVPIAESDIGLVSGLVWRVRKGTRASEGLPAGSLSKSKNKSRRDWSVSIDRKKYLVSRIIYFIVHKVDPKHLTVDHINRNPLDNNASNLRLANTVEQAVNQKVKSTNTSGSAGVCWIESKERWLVQLSNKGYKRYCRTFECKIKAAEAYNTQVLNRGLHKLGKTLNDISSVSCSCDCCL
jgi:hypothetical protein